MFNYALDRKWIDANPAARISAPGQEQSRDRLLDDDELRELWHALETLRRDEAAEDGDAQKLRAKARINRPDGPRLPSAVADRTTPWRSAVNALARVDLEHGWWSIPAAVAKNAKPHRVPLTKPVLQVLEERRKLAGEDAIFVFENKPGAGSIAHRGKKAASLL